MASSISSWQVGGKIVFVTGAAQGIGKASELVSRAGETLGSHGQNFAMQAALGVILTAAGNVLARGCTCDSY